MQICFAFAFQTFKNFTNKIDVIMVLYVICKLAKTLFANCKDDFSMALNPSKVVM